ncbi:MULTISPECIES: RNA polymerase sigma factor SigI [Peribacillus]|uniref:RNA polymerase sigma factor SigI n=1 Tax=Peribacillus TaxID=2675229 RepID=UPI001912C587|nr:MULTISPECIES: RNA polymerase sigma factor SigI [unclassified Peribacillus]MBK5445663.1 RNA polymerase sigma factor SigI [Peribacillus sp. TH24]MBK5481428.1 RNA polymerase sigma factor SigI [Peribacillus sp. TH16]MBK5497808.1 RNA polymerase sigma factor SigI [Peribacillus sp. TH14]WMX57065.1 RNA polymerase sigma factor SigI [Peribacillus sp. R9-11]
MLGLLFTAFKKKRSLEETVLKIQQGDISLRNDIIESFKPFIAKAVSSVCRRYIYESDDEFSIGLIAFNEAIDKYSPEKGRSLLAFAETLVKRRVIDYLRSQSRSKEIILDFSQNEENDQSQIYLDNENSIQEYEIQKESEKRKEEIQLYISHLQDFGLSFDDLVENSPKHADARKGAIMIAKLLMDDDDLKEILFTKKRLPVKQLEGKVDVSRKTIERNRKYIIAVAIIINGDFLYLNDYIKGVING